MKFNFLFQEIRELRNNEGFPAIDCVNYLAGNVDNSRTGGINEPRADWQYSK